jgi:hypothetical protein
MLEMRSGWCVLCVQRPEKGEEQEVGYMFVPALALTHYRDLVESVERVNVLEEGIKRLTRVLRDVGQRQSLLPHEQEEMAATLKTVGLSSFPEPRF